MKYPTVLMFVRSADQDFLCYKELVAGGSPHIAGVALFQGTILGRSIFAFKGIDAEVALDGRVQKNKQIKASCSSI